MQDVTQIQGWGADLDPKNRPAVPKERIPARDVGAHWEKPEQQLQKVRIFRSIEHPTMTPVFGTASPPRGLSGKIRAGAYKFSEGDMRHWLMLLFADRVDMVEGVFEDLARGKVPNIFAEAGLRAELKYNKAGFVKKVVTVTLVAGAVAYLIGRRRKA